MKNLAKRALIALGVLRPKVYDLRTDAGALEAIRDGVIEPHEAPLAVLRDMQRRQRETEQRQ